MSLINNQSTRRVFGLAAVMFGAAVTLSACGGDKHEVKAVDRVEEAAELARANAPEAEVLEFDDAAVAAEAEATDATAEETDTAAEDATADAEEVAVEETAETEATDEEVAAE